MEDKKPMDEKEDRASIGRRSFSIPALEKVGSEEPPARILFASDPREKHRHDPEITALPLSRTFSRNSYSLAADEESKRVRRVAAGKAEPQTRFPTGDSLRFLLITRVSHIEHQCHRYYFTRRTSQRKYHGYFRTRMAFDFPS
jgi:hypothetical protein